jgi:hypothetical protein
MSVSLTDVLQWQWPGAHYVVSATGIQQWYGPMDEPSEAEVAAAIVAYEAEQIEPWASLRLTRNAALAASDWTELSGAHESATNSTGLTPIVVGAWQVYRQQLRNLPATVSNPANPDWPVPPTS